ncbi:hypothetical protein ACG7TL_004717 [Trametes sanguinea]
MMVRTSGVLAWSRPRKVEFELSKTALVVFSRRREPIPGRPHRTQPIHRPDAVIAGQRITPSTSVKHIGVILDQELRFKEHAQYALGKGQYWATQFQRLAQPSKGMPARFARQLYIAVAVPRMLYAVDVWGTPTALSSAPADSSFPRRHRRLVTKMARVQRQVSAQTLGAMRTSATDILDAHADLLPFPQLLDKVMARAAISPSVSSCFDGPREPSSSAIAPATRARSQPANLATELLTARFNQLVRQANYRLDSDKLAALLDTVCFLLERGLERFDQSDPFATEWIRETALSVIARAFEVPQPANELPETPAPANAEESLIRYSTPFSSPSRQLDHLSPVPSEQFDRDSPANEPITPFLLREPSPEPAMAERPAMPPRGDPRAPYFDPDNPRTLRRFFQDLEALFERSGVESDAQKKQWVLRYFSIDVADLCENLPECADETKTYDDFKRAIIALYPGADDSRKYSLADVENLVARRASAPIATAAELSSYYRDFYAMTSYLISQNRLSTSEQSRLFVRGIAQPLWGQVSQRLQLKLPDHYPEDPYKLDDVYNAAKFVLHGTVTATPPPAHATTSASNSGGTTVKIEDFASLLRMLTQAASEGTANATANMANRFANTAPGAPGGAPRYQGGFAQGDQRNTGVQGNFCHYCGNPGCQLRNCPFVEEDIRAGRCVRNQDGRVVLPNGNFVPRQIPGFDGITMRDRVYEWHRRNPNALAPPTANQMVLSITTEEPRYATASSFTLSAEDRIEQLERELFALQQARRTRFDGVHVPPRRPQRSRTSSPPDRERGRSREPRVERELPPHLPNPAPARQHEPAAPPRETRETRETQPMPAPAPPARPAEDTTIRVSREQPSEPRREAPREIPRPPTPGASAPAQPQKPSEPAEHPFAKARDATYAPPRQRNFGQPMPRPKSGDREPAYRTRAPIQQEEVIQGIFQRTMASPYLTVSLEEILSISPDMRARFREKITPRRVPPEARTVAFAEVEEVADQFLSQVACDGNPMVPGGVVVPDPYEVYLRDIAPSRDAAQLTVAKESHALRSIVGLVDNKEYVEAIVDPGCQVIAMSENVCHALALAYDPSIRLNMQSANGEVDKSLGLVRNVPFAVADIVLYLQIHVIRNAAYDMLLGRPFDVLTKSVCPPSRADMLDFEGEQPPSPSLEDLLEEDGEQIALVISEDGGVPRICAYSQIHDPELSIPAIYLSACDELPKMAEVFFTRTNPESEPISPVSATPSASRDSRTPREDTPQTPSNPANTRAAPPSEDTTRATFAQSAAAQPAATNASRYSRLPHDPNNTFAFTYSNNGTTYVVSPRSQNTPAGIFVQQKKKYKPVAQKVRATLGTCPEQFRVERNITGDPLADMPKLNPNPPEFEPTGRYTQERKEAMDRAHGDDFLWPEEKKLLHDFMRMHNEAFAWNDSERGCFKPEFFPPIEFPVLPHTPWVEKNIPIPPGLYKEVCEIIKKKIAAGVYEPSNSSYRSRWFCVLKKDGKSLRIVHSLEPLNRVTIQHSGVPPTPDYLAEQFAGRPCGAIFDLYVGYDERLIAETSRDLTSFQTPFGALRLCTLPMGWSNSVPIFHEDVTYILRPEIPEVTVPYIDDVPCKGPESDYRDEGGTYETIPANPGIRRFVWEHFENINRVVQRMKYAGGTFSGTKSILCAREITVVGHRCTPEGRLPEKSRVAAVKNWGPCKDLSEVRAFLGTVGVARIFIRNFAKRAHALVKLTRKDVPFEFGEEQIKAMEDLKEALLNSPALRAINYESLANVILAVDTSYIAVGYHLCQCDEQDPKKRYYNRFGSITLNDRESRFSQPKLELYGLFRALQATKLYIVGVRNLVVEVDARYIRGMLNNPDLAPSASINRWILAILTFHFHLVHVPGTSHGPDGLSRRPPQPGDDPAEDPDEFEDWIDRIHGFLHQLLPTPSSFAQPHEDPIHLFALASPTEDGRDFNEGEEDANEEASANLEKRDDERAQRAVAREEARIRFATEDEAQKMVEPQAPVELPYSEKTRMADEKLRMVAKWFEAFRKPEEFADDIQGQKYRKFIAYAQHFFRDGDRLWRKDPQGAHKLVVWPEKRLDILRAAHDDTGHRGHFATVRLVAERFWWPSLHEDAMWYVRTCHLCQLRQHRKLLIPPTVARPGGLCVRWYIDSMKMPKSSGFSIIVVARCSVSAWPEWRMLRAENDKTLGDFIFQDLLCRWGAATELITDNGSAFVSAVRSLEERYHIHHIKISPYNSKANGIAERSHFDTRQILFKAASGDQRKWSQFAHYAFWAERVTVRKRMGCSPYFAVTGCHPVLPLDIAEATYLVPPPEGLLSTEDLIARRAIELQKRQDQLAQLNSRVFDARIKAAQKFERAHAATIRDYDFPPGSLVLMRHTQIEKSLNRKMRPRYTGPLVVISRNRGGAYVLCELDGSVLHRAIAAFRLIPYLARGAIPLPANFTDISHKRLSELIASDDDGEDDPEPELIGEPVADRESDEDASSESSFDD